MNVTVDDAAPQWDYFFASNSSCSSSSELAGWNRFVDGTTVGALGPWNGTETWSSTPGASMMLAFQGTQLTLYSTISPDGGNMSVVVDDITTNVSLYSPDVVYGNCVFSTDGLDPNWMHALRMTMLNGTMVNVDKVVVQPPPPNAFPPAWPKVQLAALPNQTGIQLPSCSSTTPASPLASPTVTTVITPKSTTNATPPATQPAKNNSGILAGVIVGTGFAVVLVVVIGSFVKRYFFKGKPMNPRRESNRQSSSGPLKQLLTGSRLSRVSGGQRHSRLKSSDSTGSFGNDNTDIPIDDVEEKHADIERGSTEMGKLPSIRHPSTIDMGSMLFRSTTPTPFLFPQAPAPIRGQSPLSNLNNIRQVVDEHRMSSNPRNRGVPFSLSINTNVNSARSSLRTKTKSSGWLTDDEDLNRVSVVGPSRLGMKHSEAHLGSNQRGDAQSSRAVSISGVSDRDATETAEFYAAYARAGFLQGEPEDYEDLEDVDEGTGLTLSGEGYDDDAIDTPLIPPSPAIPSSNASVAHGGASVYSFTSGKHASKASKVLQSFRSVSRSSTSKSLRHSVGQRSTQSSVGPPKSPESSTNWNSKTPRTPVSAQASGSTRSRKSSTPSVPGHGMSVLPSDVPAVPAMAAASANSVSAAADVGADLMATRLPAPPSAWSEAKKQILMRPYKPPAFGPRARSESSASVSSTGSGSVLIGSPELLPTVPASSVLSVVEENGTPSISRVQSSHDLDIS